MTQTSRRTIVATFLMALTGATLVVTVGCAFYSYGQTTGTGTDDALDYAAMGRNLARGEGFTTAVIYPLQVSEALGLPSSSNFKAREVPNLHRPPLLPLVYSLAYKFLGDSPILFPAVSFPFYCAIVVLVGIACRNRWVVALTALFPPLVRQIPLGLAEIPSALVCLAGFVLLIRAPRKPFMVLLLGLLAGAGFLLKSYLLLLLPAFAVFLWMVGGRVSRFRNLSLLTFGWAILTGPWLVRNVILTGYPFFTLQAYCEISKGIPGYEAFRIHRGLDPLSTWEFAWNHPAELAVKSLMSGFIFARSDLGMNLFALALGAFAWRWLGKKGPESQEIRQVLGFLLGLNLLLAALLAPINLEPRYLLPTLLPLLVLSFAGLSRCGGGFGFEQGLPVLMALFTVLNFAGFTRAGASLDRREDGKWLASRVPEDGLVLTDADGFVAWFADRPAMWLPADEAALVSVLEKFPVGAVYLQEGKDSPYFFHYASPEATADSLRSRFETLERTPSGGFLLR